MSGLTAAFVSDAVELRANATENDLQFVIRAACRQVLGNAHLMENQRLTSAESLVRGDITSRDFVRQVAKSDLYQSLFFNTNSAYRFIELNCKHLLGRPPLEQTEISAHVKFVTVKAMKPKSILISIVTITPRTLVRILCLILGAFPAKQVSRMSGLIGCFLCSEAQLLAIAAINLN